MIGKLKGVIDSYGEDFVIVDVGGVGYVVHCSSRTLQHLPSAGEAATLSIETHVREDTIRLFGFPPTQERDWFRLLQTVQGVGAKVALAILSTLDPGELATAIATGDKASVARAPGVGPKLAAAHRGRAQGQGAGLRRRRSGADPPLRRRRRQARAAPVSDAVSALVNLGYAPGPGLRRHRRGAAQQAGEAAEAKTLIRLGLRELAR